jgi:hypothetical protein
MAATFASEDTGMHPQIANSFITLLSSRERRPTRKRFWLFRLFGRG